MDKHTTWQRIGEETVYKGRIQVVKHTAVLPSGRPTTYEVEHSDGQAAAVLIKTPDNQIVLTHQFRFPLDCWIYDLPGGGCPAGESVEQAAIRECQEEVGLRPNRLIKLQTFYPNPGRADWCVTVFYCDDYSKDARPNDDPAESVETVLMPVRELHRLITSQQIIDPSLLIAWHSARDQGCISLD